MVKKIRELEEGCNSYLITDRPSVIKVSDRATQTFNLESKSQGGLKLTETAGLLKRVNYEFDKVELHRFHCS